VTTEQDWIFDAIWELSDKSLELGLPDVASRLEEAMDALLYAQAAPAGETWLQFRSRRKAPRARRFKAALSAVELHRRNARDIWQKMAPQKPVRSGPWRAPQLVHKRVRARARVRLLGAVSA